MARPAPRLALFDLDNTLLAGDSDHAWGEFLISRGIVGEAEHRAKNDAFYEQYVRGELDIHGYVAFTLEPILSLAISRMGVASKKYSANPGVSYTRPRYAFILACEIVAAASKKALLACLVGFNKVASSVAATKVSRLRLPISGLAYLDPITSPCSVKRICPRTVPGG